MLWNIAKGYQYRKWLESGIRIKDISRKENKQESFITRILRLSYLNPEIVKAILTNNLQGSLSVGLLERISQKSSWRAQSEIYESLLLNSHK